MRFPNLIPNSLCNTAISIEIEQEGVDKYGEPYEPIKWEGRCNYQDTARSIFREGKKNDLITGTCLIPGDIVPQLPVIGAGYAVIHGVKRTIVSGAKCRNPDGTVNFTRIEVN